MTALIQLRRDTAAAWTAADPVLASGEPGWETDTSLLKVGDGLTAWSALDYYQPGGSGGASSGYPLDAFTPDPVNHWDFSAADVPAGISRLGYVDADDVGDGDRLVVTAKGPGNYHYAAAPAGDWIATAKVWGNHTGATGAMFGLMALDNTSAGVGISGYTGPEGYLLGDISAGSYAGAFGNVAGGLFAQAAASNTRPCWYRLARIGSLFTGSMSWDGISWNLPIQTRTKAGVTRVALGGFTAGAAGTYKLDWLNIAAF